MHPYPPIQFCLNAIIDIVGEVNIKFWYPIDKTYIPVFSFIKTTELMNFKYYNTTTLIIFLIVVYLLSLPIAFWIKDATSQNQTLDQVLDLVGVLSPIGIVTGVVSIINVWGWKWYWLKWLVNVPDISGRYSGKLTSSYPDASNRPVIKECVLEIKQSASAIHIRGYFGDEGTFENTSTSVSVSEELVKEKDGFFTLYYIFSNESQPLQVQLKNHAGTSKFKYYPDIRQLNGDYYNQRTNYGTIMVSFEQEELLGRLVK